jgi:hypothetical protein
VASSVSRRDITDTAPGWTEAWSVRNKAHKWVFAAITHASTAFPFPILGKDSDNGSEVITGNCSAVVSRTS